MSLRRPLAIALASSVALAGLVTVAATSASGAPPTNVQIRAAVTNTSVMAVIKTIPLLSSGDRITGVAVNSADDSIYVATGDPGTSKYLMVVNGDTGATRTLNFDAPLTDVAVNQVDDTVYVTVYSSSPSTSTLYAIRGATDDSTVAAVGTQPRQIAVNSLDDTVYVTNNSGLRIYPGSVLTNRELRLNGSNLLGVAVNDLDDTIYVAGSSSNNVSFVNGVTDDTQQFAAGTTPSRVAVNQGDDTVYVTRDDPDSLLILNGATGPTGTAPSIPYMTTASDVAVHQGDDTVYVTAPAASASFYVLRGTNLDDSTISTIGSVAGPLAVDDTGDGNGLVYVAGSAGALYVVGLVSPVLSGAGPGAAGATVTVSVTSTPTVGYSFDSDMVSKLRFNGTTLANASPGQVAGQWTATLPSGLPAGPVTVEAVFDGGYAYAGEYTVEATPTPTPTPTPTQPSRPDPPGAPAPVLAQAGDRSGEVTWGAPSFSGSGPVTEYEAEAFPGGNICRATPPTTSCTVTGLSNGSGYVFRVRAKNYVGWGSWSEYSNMVTPKGAASIVITGSRDRGKPKVIKVSGTTTGLTGSVTPWLRLGSGTFKVEPPVRLTLSGTFRWSVKTSAAAQVYVTQGSVKSNTVSIRAIGRRGYVQLTWTS